MRRIVTAISAAALALSLVAQATPAQAATGYDSAYAGESAFLTLDRGATGSFTVFFANTGTTSWLKGGSTQVDLAACKDDKVTCNAQDASDATFNSGWISATRYASTTQTTVAPGSIGTFTYSVKVPADAAAGTYRFNGALVVASSGADVHNEGYYQDVAVSAVAGGATITSIVPDSGDDTGGTNVVITGTGFVCTTNPTVDFGTDAATVLSCGETSITVSTPAHAIPAGDSKEAVDVTVTNAGGTASNAVTYTYNLSGSPTATDLAASGDTLTLTFSQPVCFDSMNDVMPNGQFSATKNGTALTLPTDSADYGFAVCGTDTPDVTATITLATALIGGDTITLTITTTGADSIENAAGTSMPRAQTLSATATADTTPPTMASASWKTSTQVKVKWSEVIGSCTGTGTSFQITGPSSYDQTSTSVTCAGTDKYTYANVGTAATKAGTYTVKYTSPSGSTNGVKDLSGNKAKDGSITFTVTAPIITDTFTTATDFTATTGDTITVRFDQAMSSASLNDGQHQFLVSDSDGTKAVLACDNGANTTDPQISSQCFWTAADTVEVTLQEAPASADLLADGDFIGLQWPLTIDDITGFENVVGVDADIANSTDVTIDKE